MTTTPPSAGPASAAPGPAAARTSPNWRQVAALMGVGTAIVLALAALARGCTAWEGGKILSETAFREHLRHTESAGEDAVRRLGLDPGSVYAGREMANASCKDDFGVDEGDVTRDRPTVEWSLDHVDRADYLAAVATLREEWRARGHTVKDVPAPPRGEPGAGLPGVRTTDDRGIALWLAPDHYSGVPSLVADGGCVRHHGMRVDWEK
ncbi:hypothetical protein [Streptomyces sp. NPDC015131]|uniref:hypothetical protein n=1 Tax=Streptomyces sp. NPDC015131 TaxID=3364941 RepID=UPI00370186BB